VLGSALSSGTIVAASKKYTHACLHKMASRPIAVYGMRRCGTTLLSDYFALFATVAKWTRTTKTRPPPSLNVPPYFKHHVPSAPTASAFLASLGEPTTVVVMYKPILAWLMSMRRRMGPAWAPAKYAAMYVEFYSVWEQYRRQRPDIIHVLCYDDFVRNPAGILKLVAPGAKAGPLPKKVYGSDAWSEKASRYYADSEYLKEFPPKLLARVWKVCSAHTDLPGIAAHVPYLEKATSSPEAPTSL
jgi:hypothetical protein